MEKPAFGGFVKVGSELSLGEQNNVITPLGWRATCAESSETTTKSS